MKTVSSGPEFCLGSVVITNSAIFALEKKLLAGFTSLTQEMKEKPLSSSYDVSKRKRIS